MTKNKKVTVLLFITLILPITISNSQNHTKQELETTITYHDSIFWKGFNTCNLNILKKYVSDDLEFYHDKDGLTLGAETFLKVSEKNLCSSINNWRLRREVIPSSIKIYAINNYGAIMSGDHKFYITENNKPEFLDGIAKFTHIWQLKDNIWKMTRVLSYDHKAIPQNTDKKEILLTNNILNTFVGEYIGTSTGTIIISKSGSQLQIKAGEMLIIVYSHSESLFFHKEKPLTFKFIKNSKGQVFKLLVIEKGNIVEEAIKK